MEKIFYIFTFFFFFFFNFFAIYLLFLLVDGCIRFEISKTKREKKRIRELSKVATIFEFEKII